MYNKLRNPCDNTLVKGRIETTFIIHFMVLTVQLSSSLFVDCTSCSGTYQTSRKGSKQQLEKVPNNQKQYQTIRERIKHLEKVPNILRRYQTTRDGTKQLEKLVNNKRGKQTTRGGTKQLEKVLNNKRRNQTTREGSPNNQRRFTKQLEKVPNIHFTNSPVLDCCGIVCQVSFLSVCLKCRILHSSAHYLNILSSTETTKEIWKNLIFSKHKNDDTCIS